jgi:hypothetical protein
MGVRVVHPHQSDNTGSSMSCDQWLVLCRPTGILEVNGYVRDAVRLFF